MIRKPTVSIIAWVAGWLYIYQRLFKKCIYFKSYTSVTDTTQICAQISDHNEHATIFINWPCNVSLCPCTLSEHINVLINRI